MDKQQEYNFLIEYIRLNPGITNLMLMNDIAPILSHDPMYIRRRWAALANHLKKDDRVKVNTLNHRRKTYTVIEEQPTLEVPVETLVKPMKESKVPTISMEGVLPDPIHMTVRSPEGDILTSGTFSGKAGLTMVDSSAVRVEVSVVRQSDGTTETFLSIVVE